jgi:hypothetical protein
MFISFIVKLIELVGLIFLTSYFFLIIWVLLCEGIEDIILQPQNQELPDEFDDFFHTYGLSDETLDLVSLKIFYYAFTSLTTVGFGDFHPIGEKEQLLCGFMLLFGVLVFSYIMGEYIALLDSYKEMMKDYDEGDELRLFFGTLRHFNNNEELDFVFRKNMENYFFYRWINYKNRAIKE